MLNYLGRFIDRIYIYSMPFKRAFLYSVAINLFFLVLCLVFSGCGKEEVTCTFCNGTGEETTVISDEVCTLCNGTGTDPRTNDRCGKCYGSGRVVTEYGHKKCEHCDGTGKVEE